MNNQRITATFFPLPVLCGHKSRRFRFQQVLASGIQCLACGTHCPLRILKAYAPRPKAQIEFRNSNRQQARLNPTLGKTSRLARLVFQLASKLCVQRPGAVGYLRVALVLSDRARSIGPAWCHRGFSRDAIGTKGASVGIPPRHFLLAPLSPSPRPHRLDDRHSRELVNSYI